jgi:Alpha/beta hydrolase of unknown function (DUF900).
VYWFPEWILYSSNGAWIDIYATNFVNGIAQIPSRALVDQVAVQAFSTNGNFGQTISIYPYCAEELSGSFYDYVTSERPIFVDARQHLNENLKFLLRSATVSQGFAYSSPFELHFGNVANPGGYETEFPEDWFARPATLTNYEYYGFHTFSSNYNYAFLEQMRPVRENYFWGNFVYDSLNFTPSGMATNGIDFYADYPNVRLLDSTLQYAYLGPPTNSIPVLLNTGSTAWLLARGWDTEFDIFDDADTGVQGDSTNGFYLPSNTRNFYGLPISSLRLPLTNYLSQVLPAGGSAAPAPDRGFCYVAAPPPGLQIVDYYFASQTPYFEFYTNVWWYGPDQPTPPLPGSPTFSVTNNSPLLIAGIGQPITVSGWAKMAITNGYPGKYAYLEQYWDKAYKIGTNGVTTTNQTGLLSPYGEFFPTEPGPTALFTMPDIDTGQRGTGIVNVIKLQLDVNHDGVMDLTFGGPDNTSQDRPFVFWIDNDCDSEDGDSTGPGHDIPVGNGRWTANLADMTSNHIRSRRGLEDFARFWICGVPSLAPNSGYQVTLSWTNIVSGSPAINLYNSVETNGGIAYLTNDNIAAAQIFGIPYYLQGPGVKLTTISSNQPSSLTAFFTNGASKYFLFQGAGIGAGELALTISQGTNILARTSAWLDLRDIKSLYEQVLITNVSDATPNSLTSGYSPDVTLADSSVAKQLIVLVHGWRMGQRDYYSFSETMFKRLYWQGYQGRFASVRWQTLSKDDFWLPVRDLFTYNKSEFRAHQSGVGVANYFNWLRTRFPDYSIGVCSHSMGGVVMMQALRVELAASRQDINNYVMMQAAVPAHCYDVGLPDYAPFAAAETGSPTPDTYRGYAEAINGALRGQVVNFFNTNDYALASGTEFPVGAVNWEANEKNYKPDTGYYVTDGTNAWKSGFPSRLLTDPKEIMSFAARPRSKAVGARPGVGGSVVTSGQVDLTGRFNFLGDKTEHSAEFNYPIQRAWPFYGTLLGSLFPPP